MTSSIFSNYDAWKTTPPEPVIDEDSDISGAKHILELISESPEQVQPFELEEALEILEEYGEDSDYLFKESIDKLRELLKTSIHEEWENPDFTNAALNYLSYAS
jgi:hypothetical protein